ncbi:uncharacterized protein CLAFUR5_04634 [Fulvia fulva]|uniref:F-box domain-containing protein n=1 Tax=Passalora fulva TaxID=5499 RepID=A0A9Q8LE12_PASFU|nr:uncharacterized protein CLAFUR5_04634 [Fulvia fulva]KAK4628634.1 hypothetical protein CLAFUR0_04663 [Fulvia fulva]UJO15727.1 hypothetical protein CLAFUR5_04634 [Fulvia fulva]WPV28632.1 hypothetical protein CLAFUW7_04667 [Fulvia fulva]
MNRLDSQQVDRLAPLDNAYLKLRSMLESGSFNEQAATAAHAAFNNTVDKLRGATRCRLLQLPAELRNTIYELAFTPDHHEDEDVDLFEAKPPTNALLTACSQTYNEAAQIYKEAYRKYWTTTPFRITSVQGRTGENQGSWLGAAQYTRREIIVTPTLATYEQIMSFKDLDLDHIPQFTCVDFGATPYDVCYSRWSFEGGQWYLTEWEEELDSGDIWYDTKFSDPGPFIVRGRSMAKAFLARHAATWMVRQQIGTAIRK